MTATSPNFVLLDVSRPEIANLPDVPLSALLTSPDATISLSLYLAAMSGGQFAHGVALSHRRLARLRSAAVAGLFIGHQPSFPS